MPRGGWRQPCDKPPWCILVEPRPYVFPLLSAFAPPPSVPSPPPSVPRVDDLTAAQVAALSAEGGEKAEKAEKAEAEGAEGGIPLPCFVSEGLEGERRKGKKGSAGGVELLSLADAIKRVKEGARAKFDETVEVHVRLGIDPKRSDQMVRGSAQLPRGTGKAVRVAVFAEGEEAEAAAAAGADVVGGADLIAEVKASGGKLSFDKCIATPALMPKLGQIARILGPRGLMPNPKMGTVTVHVGEAVRAAKRGKADFKADKTANVHVGIGKVSFPDEALAENAAAFAAAVLAAKPVGLKKSSRFFGYFSSFTLSSTMGKGVRVTVPSIAAAADGYIKSGGRRPLDDEAVPFPDDDSASRRADSAPRPPLSQAGELQALAVGAAMTLAGGRNIGVGLLTRLGGAMRLQGKVAFITGAARGIGAACARKFVAEGARVAIADVLEEEGRQLAAELAAADSQTAAQAGRRGGAEGEASAEGEKGDGGCAEEVGEGTRRAGEGSGAESIPRAVFVRCDVCDRDSIASALAAAAAALSPRARALHVLVNNAALQSCKSLPDTAPRDWDAVIAASLSSVFHATQLALPYLRRAERGAAAIVNVSSSFALVGSAGYAAYHAAKGGVSSLTRAAALGLVAEGVRVNAVCPGTTLTPGLQESVAQQCPDPAEAQRLMDSFLARQPLGRFGRAEEVANVVAFVASEEASFMVGANVVVDGGYTVV
ncbi:unnamed protein product [Closterium sp. Yama58-4]|nr:unnamed protein product [Closterium sp. Yama58-4]